MLSNLAFAVGLVLTILNILDKILSRYEKIKDKSKNDAKKDTITETDINTIKAGNSTILIKLDKMDTKMDNHAERLVRVEESAKQAHKRIDDHVRNEHHG